MSYNTKNYTEQGGDKTVIGGILEIKDEATVVGLSSTSAEISPASKTKLGGIKAGAKTETDTVEVKIGSDDKLYVKTYPTIPVIENQGLSETEKKKTLKTHFKKLQSKIKTAGIMVDDLP